MFRKVGGDDGVPVDTNLHWREVLAVHVAEAFPAFDSPQSVR
jgi:hypothetical protein